MFSIEYQFSPSRNQSLPEIKDSSSIRYDLFLWSLKLIKDDKIINMDWGRIPLADFAISLSIIIGNIFYWESKKEEFEFTESDAKLFFEKNNQEIKISTNFSEDAIIVDSNEFIWESKRFYSALMEDIIIRYPMIKDNAIFNQEFPRLES